ncbi:MAG: hypothetical protein KGQ41_04380 [Alphaproteobacteria bacterium]|nr:hypothetical protein [Alphaproteobacteria bacterium]
MAKLKFPPMQHETFPRKGIFHSIAPLSFTTGYHWPATTLDTLRSEGLRHEDYQRLVEEAAKDLGVAGLNVVCRGSTLEIVLDIYSTRNFRTPQKASAFVESVFNRLEPALNKRLQAHIDNPHHVVTFPQAVAQSSTILLGRQRLAPVMA